MERNSFGQESERDTKFYRFIFDSVHDPILVIRTSGRIIDANQALTDALGYSKEELLCMNIADLRAPGEKGRTKEDLEKSYDGCVFETAYKRKDGSVFPVEISVRGAMLGGEKALFGIIRDITKRKQTEGHPIQMEWLLTQHYEQIPAEEALRESEEKFRTLADASPAAIIVYQGNRQRYANATAIATFGYTEQELLSMNFLDLIHPDHRAMVERIATSRMHGEQKPARYEVKVLTKDREEKWLDISSRLISYEGSRAGIVICTDITERKQAEEELKIAKEQAELYLDLMSHDISNMHQIMLMQLEMAKDILDTEGSIEKDFEEVITGPIQALQRSANLIQSVRKIQQVSSGNYRPEVIDIGMVLQGVVREYSSVPGRDVKIRYTPRDGYCVRANHMIKDVFTNIVDNAVKHSKDPVVIDLSVDGVEENGQSYCRVTIADNGNGVSDDRKEQIFHRLKGGQAIERRTGLGLYIVKTLVQSFGGSIWVEDRVPGDYTRGAKFIVMLPVDDE